MNMTYSYDPTQITGNTVSRARFELGDTVVEGEAHTALLCDEEYAAIIQACKRWPVILYHLCDAICMKLQYEVDWHDDGAAFSLNQRAQRFQALRDELKAKAYQSFTKPTSSAVEDSKNNPTDFGHYFRSGMMASPNVNPPSPYGGEG